MNAAIPTRKRGNSQCLFDYILTDHSKAEEFVTFTSDTPFRTTKNVIDHRATSIVTEIEVKEPPKVFLKEFFDKSNYSKDKLRPLIENSDWSRFNEQSHAEDMYTDFLSNIESAFRKCVPKKTVYIRNDKSK